MATVLITGANRGIGLEFCRQLKARGDQVIAACRKGSEELSALDVRVEEGLDVGQDSIVQTLRERLEGTTLDVVINNAGVMRAESFDNIDFDELRVQFEINSLGPLRVSSAVAPLMAKGGKIAIVTSRMGSIADNTSGGRYGYRMSKAAVNMAGVSLSHELKPQGVSVVLLHPGFVRTDMTSGNGMIDTPESVTGMLARIDALTLDTSGGFWHTSGEELLW